jgi:hypothetical protein
MGRAPADLRALGLVEAQAYATAGVALWPRNKDATALLDEIATLRNEEAQPVPPLSAALSDFDDRAVEFFDVNLVEAANMAEQEALHRCARGLYHTALPAVELALSARLKTVGSKAVQTLRAERLKVLIVSFLGRADEALPIARAVADAQEASPALGSTHPHTLASRYLVAQLLDNLGHSDEALPIARAVADAQEASPALGSTHPQNSGGPQPRRQNSQQTRPRIERFSGHVADANRNVKHEHGVNPDYEIGEHCSVLIR